jgi:hypothetical protein
MALAEHGVEIATGRRGDDGHVRVYLFTQRLLALTIEGHGERAPTLLLTPEQARRLQEALASLIPLAEEAEREHVEMPKHDWQNDERRHSRELR